jgi:hypothetical protein
MPFQFGNPKVKYLAKAFGWKGVEISSSQEFAPAVSDALNYDGRTIIFVSCYPEGDLDLSDQLERACAGGSSGPVIRLAAPAGQNSTARPARIMHNSYK